MKTYKFIAAQGAALLVLALMLSSALADPQLPGNQDSSDVTDQNPSWATACRNGWRNSTAYNSCTTRGTVRVDFTRTCTVDANCTTDDGGTKAVHHRGKAGDLRTLVNCDGDLVRNACPPPPPPPDPPHPGDSYDVKAKLTAQAYQARHASCLNRWQYAPFITYRNCWDIDIEWILNLSIEDLLAGRICKVTATCRRFITITGLGRLANDLTTSIMVKPSDVSNIYECDGSIRVGSCPAGVEGTDRRTPAPSE